MCPPFFVGLVSCLACSTREKKLSEDEAALAKLERSKATKEGERREVSAMCWTTLCPSL